MRRRRGVWSTRWPRDRWSPGTVVEWSRRQPWFRRRRRRRRRGRRGRGTGCTGGGGVRWRWCLLQRHVFHPMPMNFAIQACVCAADSFCCVSSWDNICVGLVNSCGGSCGATGGGTNVGGDDLGWLGRRRRLGRLSGWRRSTRRRWGGSFGIFVAPQPTHRLSPSSKTTQSELAQVESVAMEASRRRRPAGAGAAGGASGSGTLGALAGGEEVTGAAADMAAAAVAAAVRKLWIVRLASGRRCCKPERKGHQ